MEVEKNLEVKKKFEKPQMEVLKLKPAGIICDSGCLARPCRRCHEDWDD